MDPETGTFLSREPLQVSVSWTGNSHTYGSGRPTLMLDPTGLTNCQMEEPECAAGIYLDPPGYPPVPNSGPDCPNGDCPITDPSIYDLCGSLYYCQIDACRSTVPFEDFSKDKADFIVSAARPVLGEYGHKYLRDCAQDVACSSRWDVVFLTNSDVAFNQAVNEAVAAAPPQAAFALKALLLGRMVLFAPVGQIWSAYKTKYGH